MFSGGTGMIVKGSDCLPEPTKSEEGKPGGNGLAVTELSVQISSALWDPPAIKCSDFTSHELCTVLVLQLREPHLQCSSFRLELFDITTLLIHPVRC